MPLNSKNDKVDRLAEEIARMMGETKTAAILRALEERRERIARAPSVERRLAQVIAFMEHEIWPHVPRKYLGRRVTRKQRERILG